LNWLWLLLVYTQGFSAILYLGRRYGLWRYRLLRY
jgi:hypothetical protein